MNTESITYGKEIRRRRQALQLSQGRMAGMSKVSQAYISAIEAGYARPSMAIRKRILRALNTATSNVATT